MFGSIMNTFNPGTKISKGQEMGYFAFGGSTIVMLVDKNLKNRSGYYWKHRERIWDLCENEWEHSFIKGLAIEKAYNDGKNETYQYLYKVIGHLFFEKVEDFYLNFLPNEELLRKDSQNDTNVDPILQICRVIVCDHYEWLFFTDAFIDSFSLFYWRVWSGKNLDRLRGWIGKRLLRNWRWFGFWMT